MVVVLGYAAYTFALGGLAYWMPIFLERVRHVPNAGTTFGLIVVGTGIVGTMAGGWLADYLLRYSRHAYLWFSGLVTLLAAPAALLALGAAEHRVYFPAIVAAELLLFMSTGPMNAAIVNVVSPLERASAAALTMVVIHLLGRCPLADADRPHLRSARAATGRCGRARPRGAHRAGRDPHRGPHLARRGALWCAARAGTRVRGRAAPRAPAADSPAQRPLQGLARERLEARLAAALLARDGLAGAHCIHELWMRGEFAANIERWLEALWAAAAATVPEWLPMRYIDWLPTAYAVTAQFRARRRGRSNLYLVLLDFADRRRGPFGVYVGMSHYRAERALRSAQGRHPCCRLRAAARSGGADRPDAAPAAARARRGGAARGGTGARAGGCGAAGRGRPLKRLKTTRLSG